VAKWDGPEHARSAGLGTASRREDDLIVGAVVAVNAAGWIDDGSVEPRPGALRLGNTTIGTVVTNARLDKVGCYVVAQGGHGGLARSITPAHTRRDGDAIVAAATGALAADVDVDLVRWLATEAVADAVRSVPLGAVGVEGEH